MKKIALAAAVASLMFAGAASAADMAPRYTKAPPPVIAPIYNWTGFYIGINGGWASSHKCWDFAGTAAVLTGVVRLSTVGTTVLTTESAALAIVSMVAAAGASTVSISGVVAARTVSVAGAMASAAVLTEGVIYRYG